MLLVVFWQLKDALDYALFALSGHGVAPVELGGVAVWAGAYGGTESRLSETSDASAARGCPGPRNYSLNLDPNWVNQYYS